MNPSLSNARTACLSLMLAGALCAQRQPIPETAIPETVIATAERTIHVYDLGDLVADPAAPARTAGEPAVDDPPTERRLPSRVLLIGELFEPREKKAVHSGPKARLAAIADLLREFVEPRLDERDEIQVVGDRAIVVQAAAAQHAWIQRWLTTARAAPDELLEVSVTFYALTPAGYAAQLAPVLARAPQPTQIRVDPNMRAQSLLLAPGDETEAFLAALANAEGVESLSAPRVLARMRESADVRTGEQVSYIRDFKVERTPTGIIADPVVDTVWDGLGFSIIGTPLVSGHLGLQIEAIVADLARPIPTFETTLGVGAPITIQLPRVRVARVRAAVELPSDHVVLFSLADGTEKPMVVVVRARAVMPRAGK